MRSRPKVHFEMKESASPGSRLKVVVSLESSSDTPCDEIVVGLVGREKRYKRTTSTGKSRVRSYHRRWIIEQATAAPGRTLTVGQHTFESTFDLPAEGLPPTYKSDLTTIEYEVTARVSIPWWPDKSAFRTLVMRPRKVSAPSGDEGPVRAATHDEPVGTSLFMEVGLARASYSSRGRVAGELSIWNGAHHRLVEVQVNVVAIETAIVASSAGPTVVASSPGQTFEPPADGQSVPFTIDLGDYVGESFESEFIRVEHFLRVRGVISLGRDVELDVPIRVVRFAAEDTGAERIARVGDDRARAAWKSALRKIAAPGVTVEASSFDEGSLRLRVDDIPVDIALEQRADGARTTATIDYPDLGLGLRVTDRAWTDLGRGLPIPRKFRDRFRAQAREAEQALSFLSPEILAALASAKEAAFDDAAAVLSFQSAMRTRASIQEVVGAAAAFARAARAAIDAMVPPSSLESSLAPYRAFAQAHGGRLCVGDMSIAALEIREVACGIRQVFEEDRPVASELLIHLPRGAAPTAEQIVRLEHALGTVVVLDGGWVITRRATVADPADLLPSLEGAAAIVLSWTRGSQGPYRV